MVSVFANMVQQLIRPAPASATKITQSQYARWQKQFTWDALHNLRYGQSFCNHFDITDNRLFYEKNWQRCHSLILHEYITS